MAEARDSSGQGEKDGSFRPFDRHALQATLADALKDASDNPPDDADHPNPPAAPPATADASGSGQAANPFGRPNLPPPPAAPAPSAATVPSTPPTRSGPKILSGGLGRAISPLSGGPAGAGLGGPVSGLRPPASSGSLLGSALSGLGGRSAEPAEETPTIALRRRHRQDTPAEQNDHREAPAPAAAPAPPAHARSSAPLAGWLPTDDDIVPGGALRRKGRRGK